MGYQPDSYYRYSYKNILTRAFVVYTIVQSKPDLTYGTTVIHHRFVSSLHWLPYWLATTAFQDNSCESFEKAMSYYSIWDLDSTSEKLLARKATAEAQATRTQSADNGEEGPLLMVLAFLQEHVNTGIGSLHYSAN
jgi:hypothetical protein